MKKNENTMENCKFLQEVSNSLANHNFKLLFAKPTIISVQFKPQCFTPFRNTPFLNKWTLVSNQASAYFRMPHSLGIMCPLGVQIISHVEVAKVFPMPYP
jgi:hypothetical protein